MSMPTATCDSATQSIFPGWVSSHYLLVFRRCCWHRGCASSRVGRRARLVAGAAAGIWARRAG